MLRVLLNAWVTKTTAAEILRNPKASSHDDHQFESPPLHHPVDTELTKFPSVRNRPTFPWLGAWEFHVRPPVGGLSR